MSDALLILAKAPEVGKAKTRLVPFLSESSAARLQEAMTRDVLRSTAPSGVDRILFASPSAAHPFFESIQSESGLPCRNQVGADLGERMENAFRLLWSEGYTNLVLIGADAPTLPVAFIQEAFRRLESDPIVLGPSTDGGYYLIALREPIEGLFKGVSWGTEQVLGETLAIVNQKEAGCTLLPFWYDVDRPRDLLYLAQHIELLRRRGEPYPEEVFRLLQSLWASGAIGPKPTGGP